MGLFEITGAVSGAHSVSLITAGLCYGKSLNLIQLAHAPWSDPAITKARIVYHPTYSGNFAYLEVYSAQAKAISLGVNLIGGQGWSLVSPSTTGAVPSGYSVKELTLAEGKIAGDVKGTTEDIAIGGNAADLASKRGQIGNAPGVTITDFDTFTTAGLYWGTWTTAANNRPPDGTNGLLRVSRHSDTEEVVRQTVYRWGTAGSTDWQIFTREKTLVSAGSYRWSPWRWILTDQSLGDVFRVSAYGKVSVLNYQGATASAPGTSGLVPPAAAGEQDLFMTGGGNYKAALTKITDSVNSAASDTAASAKAVKSAYDRGSAGITAAEKKLPLSGGTMSGAIAAAASLSKVLCGSTAAQRLHYCGGTSTLDGGHFVVEGKNGSVNPGGFEAVATDGSVRHSLIGRLDGLLAWDGKAIEFVASKIIGEQNGCIQFASGLQICWGVVGNKSTVTFRRAFKSVPIVAITHIMASTNGAAVPIGSYPTTTTLYCRDGTNETTYGNGYIAIGEGA